MFYCAFIPLLDADPAPRARKMAYGMRASMLAGRRPHLYFNTMLSDFSRSPIVLAPLAHSYLEQLNPLDGKLTKETDRARIAELMEDLKTGYPVKHAIAGGYSGGIDDYCRPQGEGKMIQVNGDEWTGTWAAGKMLRGRIFYATGNCYEGELDPETGLRCGIGHMVYFNGDEYQGSYVDDKRHGEGELVFANGDNYKGSFAGGLRCGFGVYTAKSYSVYTGYWERDVRHGSGMFVTSSDFKEVGIWAHDKPLLLTKPVVMDRLFVFAHVLMGYADLVTDVLSIVQFQRQGNAVLMGLNAAFLIFNLCVDVALMPDAWGRVLTVLQLQQAVQAYESLALGQQTESFERSKKVDAFFRSVPSIVLQLYGLLSTLPTLQAMDIMILTASIASGLSGSAMTLGSLAPKSGDSLFSYAFAVHFCYYICELTARLLSMSLLFVSIGPVAFIVLGADTFLRLFALALRLLALAKELDKAISIDALLLALVVSGSDGPEQISSSWSFVSSVVLLIALFLINLLNTPTLAALRATHGGVPVQAVTALACVALFCKYAIGDYIKRKYVKDEQLSEGGEADSPMSHSASQNATLIKTFGPSRPIRRRSTRSSSPKQGLRSSKRLTSSR